MSDWTVTRETPESERVLRPTGTHDWLPPGTLVGERYRVVRHMGSGGMGAVFEVEHLALEQRCALKVLLPQLAHHQSTVKRFHREARAMAKVQSAHVTRIMDFGSLAGGVPYFVMELLRGEDLAQVLDRESRLSLDRTLRLGLDACWGLSAVHDAELVHRDIKPANLFLTKDDSGAERCKLLDFGVIKSGLTTDTGSNRLVGTLRYMAPEQLNSGKADARTDVYALSAVLYECLSGNPPHQSDRLERVLFAIMNETPRPLAASCPGIPPALDAAIRRGLARSPMDRFGSAREFGEALRPMLTEPALALSNPQDSTAGIALSVSHRRAHRRRVWSVLGVVGLGATTAGWLALPALRTISTDQRSSVGQHHGSSPAAAAMSPSSGVNSDSTAVTVVRETAPIAPRAVDARAEPSDASSESRREFTSQAKSEGSPSTRAGVGTQRAYRGDSPSASEPAERRGSRARGAELLRVGAESAPTSIDPQNPYGN